MRGKPLPVGVDDFEKMATAIPLALDGGLR